VACGNINYFGFYVGQGDVVATAIDSKTSGNVKSQRRLAFLGEIKMQFIHPYKQKWLQNRQLNNIQHVLTIKTDKPHVCKFTVTRWTYYGATPILAPTPPPLYQRANSIIQPSIKFCSGFYPVITSV